MTVQTQNEDPGTANGAPGKGGPTTHPDLLSRLTTTVPREYVHRSGVAEVFLTGCEKTGDTSYALTGQWPRAHTFFTTADGTRHDPLQAAETIRQTGLYLAHAELGVPLGHQFVLWDLHVTAHAEHMVIGTTPSDLTLTAVCSDMAWKGRRLSEFRMEVTVERNGRLCASGGGRFTCIAPATYRRLRGAAAGPRTHRRPPARVDPALFGRLLPSDVVLAPTGRPDRWLLAPDPQHPVLFEHGGDHIPGMVLLEAARQAACGLLSPFPLTLTDIDAEFSRYTEFDIPCWIEATPLPDRDDGTRGVFVTGRQNDTTVFSTRLSATVAHPALHPA